MADIALTLFLAKILGIFMIMGALALAVNKYRWENLVGEIEDNHLSMLLAGTIALLVGLIIVLMHNVWRADWSIIITVFGWLGVLKGIMIFLLPSWGVGVLKKFMSLNLLHFSALIWFVVGVILTLGGFGFIPLG